MPYDLNIPGWMSEPDLQAIQALAQRVPPDGIIVEVGPFLGRSTYAWAKSCHPSVTVHAIDPWQWIPKDYDASQPGGPLDPKADAETLFRHYVRDCPNVRAWKGYSPKVEIGVPAGTIDLIFLDGQHVEPHFSKDLEYWYPRLKPGGIFCGDDYLLQWPDVMKGVDRHATKHGREVRRIGDKIWVLV